MIVLVLFLVTMAAIGLSLQRGIVSENTPANNALVAGLGAGLGVTWRYVAGQAEASILIQMGFTALGILGLFGAYLYGRRIRRLRALANTAPETFE